MKLLTYDEAATALKNGEIIAYPTEGVYGFAADAMNAKAVEAVLSLKDRSASKGFIVMAASLEKLSPLIKPLTNEQRETLLGSLRGGSRYTWIVPAQDHCPEYLRGQFTTLAVRVTNHPDALALCDLMPVGVVSTSANLHKEAPLESPEAIMALFGDRIAGVMVGNVGGLSSPTRIVHLESGEVIRA
ncbi:Sua5/YciO/YrdC/YwlC family protein [Ignatzschineria rhizosphaerae]|uniref:Threonylcarbamoyl-AMP synthase n=1 Tax=Ignatzschineria rhizosphaerae TaxID=2923279 RepID=A0ABY3X1J5_9GAMM|nr:Sua5/YciO/YrdC/YwlC family protein [Ignatzschineria rhizosphaerae]UNM95327.1 Sua5/YciO/YrdC/YwlC family protein [Ignatzschineria rhizosphaerae]